MDQVMNVSCPTEVGEFCDYIEMFHSKEVAIEHLTNGQQISKVWYTVFGILITTIGVCSAVANTIVVLLFFRAFKNNILGNLNVLSLVISNLGMCFSNFPVTVHSCFHGGWQLGPEVCNLDAFLGAFFAFGQIGSLTDIALLKYDIITVGYGYHFSVRRIVGRLITVWMTAFILAVLPYFGFGRFMLDGILISCTFNYLENDANNLSYVVLIYVFGIIVPISVIIYCYHRIVTINKQSAGEVARLGNINQQTCRHRKREKQLLKAVTCNVVCFVVTWSPYAIIPLVTFAGVSVSSLAATLAVCLAKASTTSTAILYAMMHPSFQKEFRSWILPHLRSQQRRERHGNYQSSDTGRSNREEQSFTTTSFARSMRNKQSAEHSPSLINKRKPQLEYTGRPIDCENNNCQIDISSLKALSWQSLAIVNPLNHSDRGPIT